MEHKNEGIKTFMSKLEESLPILFDRETASNSLGGLLTTKSLCNADMKGVGPKVKMKLGKKIVYERDAFLEWVEHKFVSV